MPRRTTRANDRNETPAANETANAAPAAPVAENDAAPAKTAAAAARKPTATTPVPGVEPTSDLAPSAFAHFCGVAEGVGATTKRLEKAAILGGYFANLPDEDLLVAARYFAGYAFPLRDQRTTNVGGASLRAAIEAVSGVDPTRLRERIVAFGDLGDAAREAFAEVPEIAARPPALALADVAAMLETLAATSGSKRKVEIVSALLARATPLEAKYVVKLLVADLRIGLKEGAVEDAIARLYGLDVGRVQWANMLTGDVGETALLARTNQVDQARMRLFHPIKFMLASPAEDLAAVLKGMPESFVVEDKFDGIRAQAHVAPVRDDADAPLHGVVSGSARVALFSRTLDEITGSFPDLVAPLARLVDAGRDVVLDGEIVAYLDGKIMPFQALQKRLGRKKLDDEILSSVPVAFFAYDALVWGEDVLVNEPFATRRAALASLVYDGERTHMASSKTFVGIEELDEEFDAARARGNEGLMAKDPASPYKPGRRGKDWLKIKRALATLDVVVTSVEVGHGRRANVLSDYTFAVRASETDPTLLNVGKAYSGLTDVEIAELTEWFRAHTLQQFAHGKVRTVEPQVVLEITFDRVQESKRHKSGYALRFPRILRIRDDKPASEVDTLDAVRKLAESEEASE